MDNAQEADMNAAPEITSATEPENTSHDTAVNADALKAEGHRDGRVTERERIAAILNATEAEGRTDLARSLATETDLDAESAIKVLSSAPEQPKTGGLLNAAMATVDNPVVGSDTPENEEDTAVEAMTARALSTLGHKPNPNQGA